MLISRHLREEFPVPANLNPIAPHILPGFITAPGETDRLLVIMAIFLLAVVIAFLLLFLRLHTLPERMAHKSQKLQFEIVAVLGLLALFTHNHIFWVAGLMLALIDFPDFGGPLGRMAESLEELARNKDAEGEKERTSKTGDLPQREEELTHV
jgi:multisubunit Na+/H+ antiporter MnhF subunit